MQTYTDAFKSSFMKSPCNDQWSWNVYHVRVLLTCAASSQLINGLRNEKLYDLYATPNIISEIECRMR
jgi:hypothetical protein